MLPSALTPHTVVLDPAEIAWRAPGSCFHVAIVVPFPSLLEHARSVSKTALVALRGHFIAPNRRGFGDRGGETMPQSTFRGPVDSLAY